MQKRFYAPNKFLADKISANLAAGQRPCHPDKARGFYQGIFALICLGVALPLIANGYIYFRASPVIVDPGSSSISPM
jgi:hypothetical protein